MLLFQNQINTVNVHAPPSCDKQEGCLDMLDALKRAAVEALGTYGLLAFVGSFPQPIGYPVPIWTLPALFLTFGIYNSVSHLIYRHG